MSSEPGKTSSESSEQAESARHGRGREGVVDVDDSGLEGTASEREVEDSSLRFASEAEAEDSRDIARGLHHYREPGDRVR